MPPERPLFENCDLDIQFDLEVGTNKKVLSQGILMCPNSYQSKDMANVKVFVGKQTDR